MISRRAQRAQWASRLRGQASVNTALNLRVGRVVFDGISRGSARRIVDGLEAYLGDALHESLSSGQQASWPRTQKLAELRGAIPRGLRERERGEHLARTIAELLEEVRR
ncbi:hypothetical protein [Granulicella tundricola]|uniref:Uncharacterized protein n=1 Tax=Granulicella tundricola (strain ATCC BAA-1859 / DSM 23138 / MP5ACTX9) TaxID=1198114 RepID=E8X5E5_GRATM|nr:hypothetical protein [Granulicella tundricola]ADW69492.1 hypothetical protein AciX9_2457 [Granulicella tundricola MP5ACTX9]